MKRPPPLIALLLWLTASYLAGFVGAQGTLYQSMAIYARLAKPVWTPPAWLFSPVWTVLYAMMGLAAWRVWRTEGPESHRRPLGLWWGQLFLVALWPWLFFAFGKLAWAFAEICLLWLTILATVLAFAKTDRKAAWLLVPYLAWVGFATVLTLAIWRMNR